MNKMICAAALSAFLVTGCGDKEEAVSGSAGMPELDKAMESTRGAMSDIKAAAGKVVDDATNMASGAVNKAGDATSGAIDKANEMASSANDMVASAKTAVSETASSVKESASAAASKVTTAASGASGQAVYQRNCQSCHAMGVAGAPKLGDKDAWAPRIATGMDALYASSINGKGIMPPKGACSSCSEDDIKAAVEYMVSESM